MLFLLDAYSICKLFLYILFCLKSFESTVVVNSCKRKCADILWAFWNSIDGLVSWMNSFIIYGFDVQLKLLRLLLLMLSVKHYVHFEHVGWSCCGLYNIYIEARPLENCNSCYTYSLLLTHNCLVFINTFLIRGFYVFPGISIFPYMFMPHHKLNLNNFSSNANRY